MTEHRVGQVNSAEVETKRVLNAGCGPYKAERLHPLFRNASWAEIRVDIDKRVLPDLVASITNLSSIEDGSFDAVWCSHNLEHLHNCEVPQALEEFRRILRPQGFVLIRSPDLEAVAALVVKGELEKVAYHSPAGPITALDMIYGHSSSIQAGNVFMAHHTGFTVERLGQLLIGAGFCEALVTKRRAFELSALALMPSVDKDALLAALSDTNDELSEQCL